MSILKFSYLLLFFLFLSITAKSQSSISSSALFGYFPVHSDNDLQITEKGNYGFHYGLNLTYEFYSLPDYNILVELSYFQAKIDHAMEISSVSLYNSSLLVKLPVEMYQRSFPLDVSLSSAGTTLRYAVGISLAYTNREVDIPYPVQGSYYEDIFNSIGIGANISFRQFVSLDQDNKYNILASLKFRYIYSFWFEGNGRDLSSYQLNYLQIMGLVGFSYSIH